MSEQLEKRLAALRSEYANGQKQVAEFESTLNTLKATLDRINSAIQEIENRLAQSTNSP